MTTFTSSQVMTLCEKQMDFSTELTSKTMFGFNVGEIIKGIAQVAGGPSAMTAINNFPMTEDSSVSSENSMSKSEMEHEKRLEDIKTSTESVREVNIGGVPPVNGNWREWASSARDRPMPILYELTPLVEVLPENLHQPFQEAVMHLYISEPLPEESSVKIAGSLNFAVFNRYGEPITSYTLDPKEDLGVTATPKKILNLTATFDIVFDGSDDFVSVVFASLVRDNISPNIQEDQFELGFAEPLNNREANNVINIKAALISYGFHIDPGVTSITVASATRTAIRSASDLSDFTFLSADNLPDVPEIIAGVVHSQGYILNRIFGKKPGFMVLQERDRSFRIRFSAHFAQPPTVIAFPIVFPPPKSPKETGTILPPENIQVALTKEPMESEFFVHAGVANGTSMQQQAKQFLGFSFLAIEGAMASGIAHNSSIGIVHGVITVSPEDNTIAFAGPGFTATALFNEETINNAVVMIENKLCKFDAGPFAILAGIAGANLLKCGNRTVTTNDPGDQIVGGVLIDFNNFFADIPAVIATPIWDGVIPGESGFELNREQSVPSAFVKHITCESTFIKSYAFVETIYHQIDDTPTVLGFTECVVSCAYPLSFHFVAVGPIAPK